MSVALVLLALVLAECRFTNALLYGAHTVGEELCFRLRLFRETKAGVIPSYQVADFSQALFKVAELHAAHLKELDANSMWDPSACNNHSWAPGPDDGRGGIVWEECCAVDSQNDIACVTKKPNEITKFWKDYRFTSPAYEMVYKTGSGDVEDAYQFLILQSTPNEAMLLNQNEWDQGSWLSMGCAWDAPYGVVWLSYERAKFNDPPYKTGGDPPVSFAPEVPEEPVDVFFIVIVAGSSLVGLALIIIGLYFLRNRQKNRSKTPKSSGGSAAAAGYDMSQQQYYNAGGSYNGYPQQGATGANAQYNNSYAYAGGSVAGGNAYAGTPAGGGSYTAYGY